MLQPQPDLPFANPLPPATVGLGKTVKRDTATSAEAASALRRAGWEKLGSGCYCTAFLSPCGTRVVKCGFAGGSRDTIAVAQDHPDNPHLPKVFDCFDLEDGSFVAEVEPLEPIEDEYWDWANEWMADEAEGVLSDLDGHPPSAMRDALAALQDVKDGADPYGIWDCHEANIMRRPSDGALVLNDLLAY